MLRFILEILFVIIFIAPPNIEEEVKDREGRSDYIPDHGKRLLKSFAKVLWVVEE